MVRRGTSLATQDLAPFLEMVAGGTPGEMFALTNATLTVGRSDDNDIVAVSEAVSRYHAVFELDQEGYWCVRDNQSKNGVQVNGQSVQVSRLAPGDLIQVGNFAFRFSEGADEAKADYAVEPVRPQPSLDSMQMPTSAKKKPNRRVVIYSLLVLFLAFVYLQTQEPDKKTDAKKDEPAKLARDFKGADAPKMVPGVDDKPKPPLVGIEDPTLKEAEQEMAKLDWSNGSLREAEQYFRKGQREYLSKNFGRSIEFFQTALTLFRGHQLADKYLRLAIYNSEQEAKRNMEIAIRYFESLQYQRAMYHFNEVISLMTHRPTEPIVTESEKYITICKKRLQAAELFP